MNLISEKSLHQINNILSIIVVIVAISIGFVPLIPQVTFWIGGAFSNEEKQLQDTFGVNVAKAIEIDDEIIRANLKIPDENTLIIPSIRVDGVVNEGDKTALNKGMWRRPLTSTPELGGNTVIVAHRFLYTNGPNTFYHLDKVEEGEIISLFWEGELYQYEVFGIMEVGPQDVSIEQNTDEPMLTLYTCTPLWTSSKRLVIKAKLV